MSNFDETVIRRLTALEREVERLRVKERPVGAWKSYTPTWTADTINPSIGNGTLSGRYFQIGKLVYCQFTMRAGSTTTFGAGIWRFNYPITPHSDYGFIYQVGSAYALDAGTANHIGVTQLTSPGLMSIVLGQSWANSTTPFTWGDGDVLEVNVIYEAA